MQLDAALNARIANAGDQAVWVASPCRGGSFLPFAYFGQGASNEEHEFCCPPQVLKKSVKASLDSARDPT